jgi:hypothetical protein
LETITHIPLPYKLYQVWCHDIDVQKTSRFFQNQIVLHPKLNNVISLCILFLRLEKNSLIKPPTPWIGSMITQATSPFLIRLQPNQFLFNGQECHYLLRIDRCNNFIIGRCYSAQKYVHEKHLKRDYSWFIRMKEAILSIFIGLPELQKQAIICITWKFS